MHEVLIECKSVSSGNSYIYICTWAVHLPGSSISASSPTALPGHKMGGGRGSGSLYWACKCKYSHLKVGVMEQRNFFYSLTAMFRSAFAILCTYYYYYCY